MKQAELINLIASPHKAVFSDLEKLQDLKKQFPFFQSAHMLLTLVSKRYDSGIYQETLRKTAITIPNRARLYDLLNAPVIEEKIEIPEEVKVVQPVVEMKTEQVEEVKKEVTEIDHLKAIELHSEKKEEVKEAKEVDLNEQVEKEVQKQIITSFVEKEILKTPDWHKKEEKKEISAGSFSDWLLALKKMDRVEDKPVKEGEQEKPRKLEFKKPVEKKEAEKVIIDKIIDMDPGNIRLDPNQRFFEANTKAKESLLENEHLVTETLAKIYALQGNTGKAIRAYEILSLKFPQKSAYFASLIENLRREKDNK